MIDASCHQAGITCTAEQTRTSVSHNPQAPNGQHANLEKPFHQHQTSTVPSLDDRRVGNIRFDPILLLGGWLADEPGGFLLRGRSVTGVD